MAISTSPKDTILSRRQIEGLIADGKNIVIYEDKVLRLNAWIKYHPGGDKSIQHVVGKDATDEINAYHSAETRSTMERYQIGRIEGKWVNFRPPIQGGQFRPYVEGDDNEDSGCASADDDANTSSTQSNPPSPLFDPVLKSNSVPKRRQKSKRAESPTSDISLSSVEDTPDSKKPSLLDLRTKEEIDHDLAIFPSLAPEVQDNIIQKYRELDQRLKDAGLFDCRYWCYGIEGIRYSFFFIMFLFLLHKGWYGCSGAFLGIFWHQLVFAAHDTGHISVTHNFQIDTVIGIIIADFFGGLSLGWWKRNHNVHHIVTNYPEHDPDIQHLPFFAVDHRFLSSLRSTFYDKTLLYDSFAKTFIKYENYLYYPILTFGRFNLYRLSWEYLFLGLGPRKGIAAWHRWLEVAGQVFFWIWFGYFTLYLNVPTGWDQFKFVMISHMITAPLHVQITLSHFAMSTADLGPTESFPQHQLRTCMDVDCPWWLDFFHGGLQFQAIHHLYPRMPRHNLRQAQKYLLEFCHEVNLPYAIYGFYDGNKEVIGRLAEIARQASILAECQKQVSAEQVRKTKIKNGLKV
ncbi:MAG: Delta 8 Fatty Acid Desaturase [Cirrosporium novae-zelandiae]|nr:MAG: Delta 8 Fatty Acid Desaturase [Cirrosporium novae-zelandiae]